MKKSLVALAVLGAIAGTAQAQSSVTIYGVADAGIAFERGGATGSVSRLGSGMQSGSRLGFKGTEDLGNGLKAMFQFEQGLSIDTGTNAQGGLPFGRQAWVGLGGNFGMVSLGRVYAPHFIAMDNVDPFGTGLAGAVSNLGTLQAVRMNNTMKYDSPNFNGFTFAAGYGFGEVAGSSAKSAQYGLGANYSNGPINVDLAYHNAKNSTNTDRARSTLLGGTYDFGMVKLHGMYNTSRGTGTFRDTDGMIGVSAPVGGAGSILASYTRKNDKSILNRDAHQWGIGYTHSLSKRTNLYTSYAKIRNKNGATYTVGDATAGGSGDKAFNVGVRHKF